MPPDGLAHSDLQVAKPGRERMEKQFSNQCRPLDSVPFRRSTTVVRLFGLLQGLPLRGNDPRALQAYSWRSNVSLEIIIE
jgi:hypothetical protein